MATSAGTLRPRCDVLIIGGGINGTGIARDLAGRGLSVTLVEQDDLAAHTSSASTKLIHGGLRYLEQYDFALVRHALHEREVLLNCAAHIIRPLRFVLPHNASMRPAWMIRLGLFLYDHLARREVLPTAQAVRLASHPAGAALKNEYTHGFLYSDGRADDARLVVLNAVDAAERGAQILTRTKCVDLSHENQYWQATLRDAQQRSITLEARAVVNAAGPWADQLLREIAHRQVTNRLRLVKGSHIVVRRMFDHPFAYIFQNADKRIVFAIPYEHDFTLIGTTDVDYTGRIDEVAIEKSEINYLCEQTHRYFQQQISAADVVWHYAGVRPLFDDDKTSASMAARDYHLQLDSSPAPFLTVWGGKLTVYRRLAEEAANRLCDALGNAMPGWTSTSFLPGGDFSEVLGDAGQPVHEFPRLLETMAWRFPWVPAGMLTRMTHAYGSRLVRLIGTARQLADLGTMVAPGLCEAELNYLMRCEWAQTAEDVLWRRTKLGLHLTEEQRDHVARWIGRWAPNHRKSHATAS